MEINKPHRQKTNNTDQQLSNSHRQIGNYQTQAATGRSAYTKRYGDSQDEDFSNYGMGGYYGSTYNQENYDRQRHQGRQTEIKHGTPDNYRNLGDTRWDDGRGGWWDPKEPSRRPGYRSDEDRFAGAHKGKGPKNYQRPDERIKEDISDRLYDDPYLDATDVEVDVRHGEVILSGNVHDRSAKRRAEDISEAVSGVKNVENRLRILQKST